MTTPTNGVAPPGRLGWVGPVEPNPRPADQEFPGRASDPGMRPLDQPMSIITASRCGSPTVADLIAAIQRFIDAWNNRCAPVPVDQGPDTDIALATDPWRRDALGSSVADPRA